MSTYYERFFGDIRLIVVHATCSLLRWRQARGDQAHRCQTTCPQEAGPGGRMGTAWARPRRAAGAACNTWWAGGNPLCRQYSSGVVVTATAVTVKGG